MIKHFSKRWVYIVGILLFYIFIGSCISATEKEYIYHNWCEDWQNTTTESIPCLQNTGVVMSVNVSKDEVTVVTFTLPPIDPTQILFKQNYCTYPKGTVSKTLYYSFSNSRPSADDNDGILETKRKAVIQRPSLLEPSTIYIGIEGEDEFNTLCFHLSIGPESSHFYGSTFHVSKNGILIRGEVFGSQANYLTIYNPERHPISLQVFHITFTNITIGGFYSFTKHDPDATSHDGLISTNNETKITWPSSLLSQKSFRPVLYVAIENIEEAEGNSTFLLHVKQAKESSGFWARWFGWLG